MSGELVGEGSQEPTRTVTPKMHDLGPVGVLFGVSGPAYQVAESRIAEFCGGCDNLGADNISRFVGSNDQGRYVEREWCGWASVDGIRGQMTRDGFISSGSKSSSAGRFQKETERDISPEGLARLGIENGRVETVHATVVYPEAFEIVTGEVAETTSEALARRGIGPGDRFSIDDAGPAVRAALLLGRPVIVNKKTGDS